MLSFFWRWVGLIFPISFTSIGVSSVPKNFPFVPFEDLELDTEIVRIGPKSGATSGLFMGLVSGYFTESGIKCRYEQAIGVQWKLMRAFLKGVTLVRYIML